VTGSRTHTGPQLGVDVMQCVERLVQDVPQGWVSHISQDIQCQSQLSLQGHRALPCLSMERQIKGPGESTPVGAGEEEGEG
jgi:hypothetical protein